MESRNRSREYENTIAQLRQQIKEQEDRISELLSSEFDSMVAVKIMLETQANWPGGGVVDEWDQDIAAKAEQVRVVYTGFGGLVSAGCEQRGLASGLSEGNARTDGGVKND